MLHDADHFADQRLDFVLFGRKRTASKHMADKAVEFRAGARFVLWPEDDMPMENVSGERHLDIVWWRIEVGELDRGTERPDRRGSRRAIRAAE